MIYTLASFIIGQRGLRGDCELLSCSYVGPEWVTPGILFLHFKQAQEKEAKIAF